MTKLSIIVAIDQKNAIGKGNQMLTHLPNDLKYFKKVTSGYSVIMGRKTFDSLPKGALPNRRNIVISRNAANLSLPNCEMAESVNYALELTRDEEEAFVIGGGMIYEDLINYVDKLYITYIHHSFEGAEVFFPQLDLTIWKEVWREDHFADQKHPHDFSFVQYEKI